MTQKTETLYRPLNEWAESLLNRNCTKEFEPVTVQVAGDLYRKIQSPTGSSQGSCGFITDYEKVTHVLPDGGKMVCDEIKELQKKVEELTQYNVTINMQFITLQNKIEDYQEVFDTDKEIIESQRVQIESQKREIERLKSELKDICEALEERVNADNEELEKLKEQLELKTEVALEWERKYKEEKKESAHYKEKAQHLVNRLQEAKKGGVVWRSGSHSLSPELQNNGGNTYSVHDGKGNYLTIYFPQPQPRTVEDEAEEAWNVLTNETKSARELFIEGYKAGKGENK